MLLQTVSPGRAEPPRGSHLVTPRRGYTHHGIYVGGWKVIQYGGLSRGLRRGPIEEVSLAQFTQGFPISIRIDEPACRDREEVIRRARSRLGEDRYDLMRNNCEHFCQWCVHGEHRSQQVDEFVAHPLRTLGRLFCVPGPDFVQRKSLTSRHRPPGSV